MKDSIFLQNSFLDLIVDFDFDIYHITHYKILLLLLHVIAHGALQFLQFS